MLTKRKMYTRTFNWALPEPGLLHGQLCPLGIQIIRYFQKRSQDGRRWSCSPEHCHSTSFQKRWNLDSRPSSNLYMYVYVYMYAYKCVCRGECGGGWQLPVCGRRFCSPPSSWGWQIVSIHFAEVWRDVRELATKVFFFQLCKKEPYCVATRL